MPQYKKVFDIGTYTGNGGQYRVGIPTLRPPGPSGKQAAGSIRFRRANKNQLTRTFGTPTSSLIWTISIWLKRAALDSTNYLDVISSSTDASAYYIDHMFNTDKIDFQYGKAGTSGTDVQTTTVVRDTCMWNHVMWSIDLTQATAANRVKIYLNGNLQPISGTVPAQNDTTYKFNQNGIVHYIGSESSGGSTAANFDGYMSEFYFVDGQQLTPSSFAEYTSDGVWVPKAYSGTYGNNGFYLPMNSTTNYYTDQSGNSNNWTPTGFNITTSNTSYDLMTDSPTDYLSGSMSTANNAGNYCIWSRSNSYIPSGSPGSAQFINGNMEASIASSVLGFVDLRGTFVIPQQGKWYFEVYQYNNSNYINEVYVGICDQRKVASGTPPYNSGDYGYLFKISTGQKVLNGTTSTYGSTPGNSTTICVAFDADNNKIWFGTNGTWAASGNPAAGTNEAGSTLSGLNYVPCASVTAGNAEQYRHYIIANFGQRPFTYTPPSGFKALNTYNLTRPADSALWFYGDTPDLMWIKNRSTTANHSLTDTLRGPGLSLASSSLTNDLGDSDVSEMNKFGMSLIGASSRTNGSTNNFVYWGWKAGGPAVSGTGNLTNVMVSTNPTAGFSVVTYTGNGVVNAQFGHGLGVTPSMTIIKNRSSSSEHWNVWHTSLASQQYYLFLETTDSVYTVNNSRIQSLTSSAVTIGSNSELNASGSLYVAYCWAAIPGYSAFGSYTGNGSTDGTFVYTGFRPRWIMVKRTDSTESWIIQDSIRDIYNCNSNWLYPNLTNSEGNGALIDLLSNGFKCRNTNSGGNISGGTYIYMAMAEIPFKFSRAR